MMMDPTYWLGQIIRRLKKSSALRLASTAHPQSFKEKSETDAIKQQSEESERNRFTDENVLKAKADFEMRLDENADLPDGIGWQKAYIYRHLMSKWFDSLNARYRYDESISASIRSEWLSYMYLLESESKSSYWSFETINVNEKESYEQTASLERKQYVAIEDEFAAAIGNEAIEELRRVRDAPIGAFDRSGRKPMAPIGYLYVPVSLHPYDEDLKPKQP